MGEGNETIELQEPDGSKLPVKESGLLLEVDRQYAAFKVEPKRDERNDANFPPHLHAGFQLFCMTKNFNQALRLKHYTDRFLALLREGPTGTSSQSMGRAAVCWGCGYTGLPRNPEGDDSGKLAVCSGCGSDDQTNWVKVIQPDGMVVPWMETNAQPADATAKAAEAAEAAEGREAPAQAGSTG